MSSSLLGRVGFETWDDDRADENLLAAARDGDLQAFAALYQRHRCFALRIARGCMASGEHGDAAEDIVQDSFLHVLRVAPRLHLSVPFRAFLRSVVQNTARMALRKEWRRRERERERERERDASWTPDSPRARPRSPKTSTVC